MKAVVYERYGSPDVLDLQDVEVPAVADDEVLIRVQAASLNRSDWETLTARPIIVRLGGAGLWKPKNRILGSDIAGQVTEVGKDVTEFRPGDEVLADTLYFGMGAFAEYASVAERAPLVVKPAGVTFRQAATLPQAALLALQGLRVNGEVQSGDKVLIVGAGGGGGTFAIQLAKSRAAEVTGVDNGSKLDLMRRVGADHVIDYTREDFSRSGHRYDRILDFSTHRSIFTYKRALRRGGTYSMVGGSMPRILQTVVLGWLISKLGNKKMGLLVARPNKDDLTHVAGLAASGKISPIIEDSYELGEVPEVLRRLGDGNVLGKAVITITDS